MHRARARPDEPRATLTLQRLALFEHKQTVLPLVGILALGATAAVVSLQLLALFFLIGENQVLNCVHGQSLVSAFSLTPAQFCV